MGYLDAYGAGVDQRVRRIKWTILGAFFALVLGIILYFQFRDYGEHQAVEAFFGKLRQGDYKSAYALWGCDEQNPCRDYRFEKFMEDWGPKSPYPDAHKADVTETHSCESGVIEVVSYPGQPNVNLWVDRNTETLSFAPWELKEIPDTPRTKFAAWMWEVTRNCTPRVRP